MRRPATRLLAIVLVALLLPAAAWAQASDPLYLEGKRLFDALDYDNAIRTLDQAIASLEARPVQDPTRRELLPSALEMRARSKFGQGDQDGAKADFVALLKVNPGFTLTGGVSPRVVSLFDTAVTETVTHMNLSVTPQTATVEFDGVPMTASGTVPVAVGDHVLTATQAGYRAVNQPVTVETGKVAQVSIALERIASVVNIFTAPANVDVTIDGVKRGTTSAGPTPPAFADAIAKSGVPAAQISALMAVNDLAPGAHVIEFSRGCYVGAVQRLTIDKPDDFLVGPVALEHAVANVTARTPGAGAHVLIDGEDRGNAPFNGELCEGDHTVDLQSPAGRYTKRLSVKSGESVTVEGALRPGVALVSVVGQPAGAPDLRTIVARAFDNSHAMTLFLPPVDQAAQVLRNNQLSDSWLAYDAGKRPLGSASDVVQPQRGDGAAKVAAAFNAQGVASLTLVGRSQAVLAVLAAGSSQPDLLTMSLDDQQSIADAVAEFDRLPAFMKPSIGVTTMDVADVTGAVILSVDAGSAAAAAGVHPGDVITKVNGAPVASAVALETLLAARAAGDALTADLVDRAGAVRQAALKVSMAPRLIGISDQTLLANRLLLELRARLAGRVDAAEEPTLRLNLAAALAHVEDWNDARTELQRVHLPDGSGVSNGTVQYLLGLCEQKLGNRAAAETAWKAAATSSALLTEDGPAVSDLAQARLAELQRAGR